MDNIHSTPAAKPASCDRAINPDSLSERLSEKLLKSSVENPLENSLENSVENSAMPAPPPAADVSSAPAAVAVVTSDEAAALKLSPSQKTAIIQLTSGATRSAAAIAAGITRTTLYRWINHDPNFQAAYNAWTKDLVTTAQGQLLAASHDAIACVLTAIRKGDARLAWKLLNSQGLTKPPKPGSTDVAHLQAQAALEKRRVDLAERKERNTLDQEEFSSIDLFPPPL